jgi:precorrin-3B methylase
VPAQAARMAATDLIVSALWEDWVVLDLSLADLTPWNSVQARTVLTIS